MSILVRALSPQPPPDPLYIPENETSEERLKRESFELRREKGIAWERQVAVSFFDSVPSNVVELLKQFKERWWCLFTLFARCPRAVELAHSNPALCFALASNWVFHKPAVKRPLREARRLIGRRQRAIAGWLGFPPTEHTRRVLSRIPIEEITVSRLFNIRRGLLDPEVGKTLGHLRVINGLVLDAIGYPLEVQNIGPSFLHDLASWLPPAGGELVGETPLALLRDARNMAGHLERPMPSVFANIAHLRSFHDRLVAEYQDRPMRDEVILILPSEEVASIPPPPLAGTDVIVPLITPDEIRDEAATMHHCADVYLPRVKKGDCFLYKVLAPVRATLEIRRTKSGWMVAQLRGFKNASVSAEHRAVVKASLFGKNPEAVLSPLC